MVNLEDLEDNFFGLVLHGSIEDSSKKVEIKPERPLHITMAALDTSVTFDEYIPVMIQKNDKSFLVCTLSKSVLQQPVELELNTAETVTFHLNCKNGSVHLTGYYLSDQCGEQHDGNADLMEMMRQSGMQPGDDDDSEEDDDDDDDEDEDEEDDDDDDVTEDDEILDSKRKAIESKQPQKKTKSEEKAPELVSSGEKVITGGVAIKDTKIGNGPEAKKGKTIQVYYTGKLKQNGKVFDSCTKGKPFKFRLGAGEVIKGWDVGFESMKVGGKRTITVPAPMGYGAKKMGNDIPANSALVFDVELKSVS